MKVKWKYNPARQQYSLSKEIEKKWADHCESVKKK